MLSPLRELGGLTLRASKLPGLPWQYPVARYAGLAQQSLRLRNFKLEFFVIRKRVDAQVLGHPDVQFLVEHGVDHALVIHQQ